MKQKRYYKIIFRELLVYQLMALIIIIREVIFTMDMKAA